MIKVILFDCDGPIIKRDKYFSQRLKEDYGIVTDPQSEKSFFKSDFLECEVGKADLKQVLPKWLPVWQWQKGTEELMEYWFSGEAQVDTKMKDYIMGLRKSGVKCFLATNNEKYRTEYLWDNVGIKEFLDGLFSSCYLGYMKPQTEYWEGVYKTLNGIEKSDVLVLDDKQSAIDSAKQFGFNAELYKGFEDFKRIMTEKYHA